MTINTDKLEALAGRRTAKVKAPWVPPTAKDFRHGFVLAFDQSLAATGFVWLAATRNEQDGPLKIEVKDADVLKTVDTAEGKGGHEENLRRAEEQYKNFKTLLASFSPSRAVAVVVREMPPNGGGRLMRPESSLLSALALQLAIRETDFATAPPIAPATWRKLVCGKGNATKEQAHQVLGTWAPSLVEGYVRYITNEAKRDALCLALTALYLGGN